MSILITTYEGTHNHPLPISATAMASTTAAAACMLTSGSSTSGVGPAHSPASAGLNFAADNSRARQFYLTNSSISPSPSHPTITLDLTNPSGTTAASAPNRFSSSFPSASRSFYSPASFSFSPSEPATWSGGYNLSYGAQPSYYKSYNVHPYAQKAAAPAASPAVPHLAGHNQLTETIAKAITTDPSFQSALAAAITSYVGGNAAAGGGGEGSPAGVGGVMKWGEQLNLASRSAAAVEVAGGNSSQQHGSVGYLQQGLGSSRPKNAPAGSPRDGS
ncbi:putative WRKY transcription factor 72 [Apostasia shenzhenica]|uniref:Putative WRKY transcription factor 72 n=1 Tax=Apostasia shenzhenica TaxID=1088818 RepID=A0A2I0A5Z4_9ASPA|nr:putative WRKY transcription factor 72 [Apostasia shenzhenica]